MADYTIYRRGSEWRKWDLHIHTPGTKKNDQFSGASFEDKWQNFITTINESDEEIAVVGITDYYSIENYFKFKSLIQDGSITKIFDFVMPNIELRMLPVTASASPINIHCLFNPNIENEIEERFLSNLELRHGGTIYNASKQSLIRLGRSRKQNSTLSEEIALVAGIKEFVISVDVLRTVFEKDSDLRKNTIIVVSNKSKDGASGIVKHEDFFTANGSQLDAVRESIYQLSDAIFSSNEGDRNYFLGKKADDKETVIRKAGSLKPCFHGSDAHENDKLFKPAENRYCWIKANPTFEGLKQTLYEPEDRVQIQSYKPDFKNDRYIISELQFIDTTKELFGNQTIYLNENLNSIIGGKSSGKTLMLYSAARSIDPEQVDKTAKRLGFEGYKFDSNYDFEVTWKNGVKDIFSSDIEKNQKIIYIPQLYINYLVEKDNKDDLNKLVEGILLQDAEFKTFFTEAQEKISENNANLDSLLTSYLQTRLKAINLQKRSKEIGKSSDINKEIAKIQQSIKEGQKISDLAPEEFKTYNELLESKSSIEKHLTVINTRKVVLQSILTDVKSSKQQLLGETAEEEDQVELKGSIDRLLDQLTELPAEITAIRQRIGEDFNKLISNLENDIDKLKFNEAIEQNTKEIAKVNERLKPFLEKLAGQKELQKLTNNLELEKKKHVEAVSLEKQLQVIIQEYANIRKRTSNLLKERIEKYESIVNLVNNTKREIGSGITLECSLIFKQSDFPLFNFVNKAAISKDHFFNDLFKSRKLNYKAIPALYAKHLWIKEKKYLKAQGDDSFDIPLRQGYALEEVLRGLIKDAFILDYSVTYKGDNLLSMSPGKKGTVLLILFLHISSSEYPILIDQPEDNLDNRTIYDLLCHMIKGKKKDRQIIIVSHNANLVVATDSENIIVANQEGQEGVGHASRYRFEYVNGSIEHTFPKNESIPEVLYQQGIREHVCDILEGGIEAFKQRERKYSIK